MYLLRSRKQSLPPPERTVESQTVTRSSSVGSPMEVEIASTSHNQLTHIPGVS